MWDTFVTAVGLIGTAFLVVFFGYLTWKKHQAIQNADKNKDA